MAKRINVIFDSVLQRQKIIQGTDVSCVHDWMNDYLKLSTWQALEANIDICEVKAWITGKSCQASNEVQTDYLRSALGHLVLASLSAGFAFENEYQLLKRAFQLYLERNYHTCAVGKTELSLIV